MKNIQFFPNLHSYRKYVMSEIYRTNEFKHDPFYHGLINFVTDHRAPLFFEQSEEYEYSHFTQYFNFVLMRTDYKNDFVRDMFFTHDYVHMIFDNPINVHQYSFEAFCEIVNVNEWVASNETETLTYYRVPGLRENSLQYTILYDLLTHAGQNEAPSHEFLLDLRQIIVYEGQSCGLDKHPDSAKVFSYLRKFKENNALWCKLWYEHFPKLETPYFKKRLCLPLFMYDTFLERYQPIEKGKEEELYQHNVLMNLQIAYGLLGEKTRPENFEECADAVRFLEGRVIMPEVAEEFHTLYMKNKFK